MSDREFDSVGAGGARMRLLRPAFLIPIGIVALALVVGFVLLSTSPVVERMPRTRSARLVEVHPVARTSQPTRIRAMGTVMATREVELRPQVNGRVVEVAPDFVPGGRFESGAMLLRIDPSDYELAVRQREAELAQARSDLEIERGNQSIALLEFELLGEAIPETDRNLVLRQPQLDSVRARVQVAEAALARARLDLERTRIEAPFRSLIRSRGVELGARVDANTPLATVVDTAAYWVEVLVPASQLRWIQLPGREGEKGSAARLTNPGTWGADVSRGGRVVRLLGDLESEGRMARLLVEIEDPLALEAANRGAPPILIGSYLAVEMQGRTLENVVAIERAFLRDDDRVWLMDAAGQLEIRKVEVAFRGETEVLIQTGLDVGDRLVISELSSPVAGMPVRTLDDPVAPALAADGPDAPPENPNDG